MRKTATDGIEGLAGFRPEPNDIVTEDSAALEFKDRHAGTLLYDHDIGSWFQWCGSHWKKETTGLAFHFARDLARELANEQKAKARYGLQKTTFASGVERFCRSDPAFAITSELWDADPFLLGTPGGVVDLRTGVLAAADPAHKITKITAVAPGDSPECPLWERFLSETTEADGELIRFLQQFCGYSLTGSVSEHALLFGYGPGGNGKSVFVNTVTGILAAYATVAAMDTFTAAIGDKHPTDLAMLRGARLVTASETEEGRAWAESRIKQMTGGDPVTARFMRQDFFTFQPAFKLIIVGNHKPFCATLTMRRGAGSISFPSPADPAVPDRDLEQKLKAEWPGILRWMIEGCLDWQAQRPDAPAKRA